MQMCMYTGKLHPSQHAYARTCYVLSMHAQLKYTYTYVRVRMRDLDTPFAMSRSPLTRSPTKPPLTSRSSELGDICEEQGMDQNEENDKNPDNPGGQTSFPTYGSVQDETEQAAPLVQEKNVKKRHKASPVVSLSSFGDVSALL